MAEFRNLEGGDLPACGDIMFRAFKTIAEQHNFPPDFPSGEVAAGMLSGILASRACWAVVAERDAEILGSIFVSERSATAGICVLTVDPARQDGKVGGRLLGHALERLADNGFTNVQLIQAAYHARSLALYAKLGFGALDMLSTMNGPPITETIPGYRVRAATTADIAACDRLCRACHGFDRNIELVEAIALGTATATERDGRIAGYATGVGYAGHGVADSNDALKALIAAAGGFSGPGLMVPTGNSELLTWCLGHGQRISQQMTLMGTGSDNAIGKPYWPSILC